jgi:alkanesulfonate monooxygenase SsuD/methylene tetrahydromethanopterin reductase-like flavin-dependent oxidoreductase (luciferase family)
VGGNGTRKTLPLAARYATEWNATFQTPDNFAQLNRRLDALLEKSHRRPSSVRRSLMTGLIFGADDAEVQRKVAHRGQTTTVLQGRGVVVGTPSEVVDQLGALQKAGVQRVMLQWLDLDDLDALQSFAHSALSAFPQTSRH